MIEQVDKQSKNIAFTPACQAATHLPSLPVSGTNPSQAAKQSPNRTLKLAPLHQCPIGSVHQQTASVERKGRKKKKKQMELVYNVKQMQYLPYTYPKPSTRHLKAV